MRRLVFTLASLGATLALAQPTPWTVAPKPRGFVRFTIEGPLDDVHGETRSMSGSFSVDPKAVGSLKGVFAVDLNSLRTGIDQRDEDMRVEFLETKRYPWAILAIDSVKDAAPASLTPGTTANATATGSFEVHGVRRVVTMPIALRMESDARLVASGSFQVPFADFNISRPQRLFLKLGDTADVKFEVAFVPKQAPKPADPKVAAATPPPPEAAPPPEPTVATVLPPAPKPKPKAKRKPKPALVYSFLFKGLEDPKARGERLFHAPETGGPGNQMTCFHCHAKSDERQGLLLKDSHIRAANTMYNAGQRPKFWNGFAASAGPASSICQKQFMKGTGLSAEQESDLEAFILAISPDPAPPLDYAANNYRSMETLLRDPTGGDAAKGKKLADTYCMTCHLDGRVGPVWAPGLYEPDWVVRRVRRLEGHQNKQMPPWTITRLPDSDLRDIVTYLTANPNEPAVFSRKKGGTAGGQR
ncbi:MAG: YceI family protein [Myxococcaceae bacterium]|jgi:polyisoprenoid-binding protein YceI/mono/diheme cytochrome c family protein|nr:YceI family protein [Myxococcaceae bacterium]